MYASLYVWVSCPVYIVVRLILCVSENICKKVCMFQCLVLYILLYVLYCVSVRTYVRKFVCLSFLSCIYCCTSYIVCQWQHMYERLYVWVSCPVYIVVRLNSNIQTFLHMFSLTHYKTYNNVYRTRHSNIQTFLHMLSLTHNIRRRTIYTGQDTQTYKLSYICSHWHTIYCVSVRTYVRKFVCFSVLSCIYYCTSYIVCQWARNSNIQTFLHMFWLTHYKTYNNIYRCMFVCLVLYILLYVL
jgi:hypothetical protein